MSDRIAADQDSADRTGDERRTREVFIAAKRHDLRTPINAIIGYSEMLIEDADGDDSSWTDDLERIHSAGKSLLVTVNEMLGADKVDSGEVDITDMASLGEGIRVAMRSDITSAVGYAEMILEDEDDLDREVAADLERIVTAASRMTELVDDIVAFGTESAEVSTAHPDDSTQSAMVRDLVGTLHDLDAQRPLESEITGHILIVDDDETNRDLLSRRLEREGHTFGTAQNGREALESLGEAAYDLVLLDIMMPVMDGYATLRAIRSDEVWSRTPVIMLSALDQIDSVARCIEMGADDFLPKPFDSVLLRARIGSSLEKKRLRDREDEHLRQIEAEQERSEQLLLNILPSPVADRLKAGELTIADSFDEVTVLFSDLVGFTKMSAGITAESLVQRLNDVFRAFDALAVDLGVEKIKTIGDAYMVVAGLPLPQPDHAARIADMAIGMLKAIEEYNANADWPLSIRVGINTGPVVAGVIGSTKFAYDLWGDAVNTASRMESTGQPGRIQVSASTRVLLEADFELEPLGLVEAKGKGLLDAYMLVGRR